MNGFWCVWDPVEELCLGCDCSCVESGLGDAGRLVGGFVCSALSEFAFAMLRKCQESQQHGCVKNMFTRFVPKHRRHANAMLPFVSAQSKL